MSINKGYRKIKRYIRAANEINIGPYTYKSKYAVKKAAETSTDPEELRTIYESNPDTWTKEELAYNPNIPEDVIRGLANKIRSSRVALGLANNSATPEDILQYIFYNLPSGLYDQLVQTIIIHRPEFAHNNSMLRDYVKRWPFILNRIEPTGSGYRERSGLDPIFEDIVNDFKFMSDLISPILNDEGSTLRQIAKFTSNPAVLDILKESPNPSVIETVLHNQNTSSNTIRVFVENYLDNFSNSYWLDKILEAIETNSNTPEDVLEELDALE